MSFKRFLDRALTIGNCLTLFVIAGLVLVYVASEPICTNCLSRQITVSGLSYPSCEVTEYKCDICNKSWKPLNLHRPSEYGCITIFR